MVKAIALGTVHVCREPGQNANDGKISKIAKVDVIPPGKIFEIETDDLFELQISGGARKATREEIALADVHGQTPVTEPGPVEISIEKAKR